MSRAPIALFYGTSTCYTEMSAEKIRLQLLSQGLQVDVFNINEEPIANCQLYSHLIFGIPTWDYGELQEDWEEIWDEIDELDLKDKPFAIYGQGDQVGYPEWFLDAMGYLHSKLYHLAAKPCGYVSIEGFDFDESKALTPDGKHFVGLALDDENEFELSEQRIAQWCEQIQREFGL